MNSLKNKRILLMCKETFSPPMYFLGKKLEKEGNQVACFFLHHTDSIYENNKSNENTYFFFKKNIDSKNFFDVRDINLEFINNYQTAEPDMDYLYKIEKLYGSKKNLNQQIMSSQLTTTPYHNRFFWSQLTYKQTLYWLELNYKKAEKIIEKFCPDMILDLDTAEIQRTILNEICTVKNIPYITIEYPRYEAYITPTFNLGLYEESFFLDEYKNNLNQNLDDEIQEINDYNKKSKIMSKVYKNDITSTYEYNIFKSILRLINVIIMVFNVEFSIKNMKIKKYKFNLPLYTNPFKALQFFFLIEFRKFILFSKNNKLFSKPENEKYIYMPLHLIPESTTFVKSPMYIDELSIIQAISKSLPIGWKLYVKEHQAMIGERPLQFYKDVNRLYNVKMISLNYFNDPKPLIENSKGIITIAGTTALEARLLNKPSAMFGHVCFDLISGIEKINSIKELKNIFTKFNEYIQDANDTKSIASYLKTIKNIGIDLDIKYLLKLSANCIEKKDFYHTELDDLTNKLYEFYCKAFEIYNKKNI